MMAKWPRPNLRGWHVYTGMALLGLGAGWWDWRVGAAVVGACLVALGLWGGGAGYGRR